MILAPSGTQVILYCKLQDWLISHEVVEQLNMFQRE